MAFPARSVG
uniref:Uncharacterized protein n=1 Tax=Arundo donax TaxID=35708 RepID=A0A0A9GHM5_ARUDO